MIDNSSNKYACNSDIIEEAFASSAMSFSVFINKHVSIEIVKINSGMNLENLSTNLGLVNYVLLSELKGDLRGKCYLKVTDDDAKTLFKLSLPTEYLQSESMQGGILMELDNILTASMVTVFSNRLNLKSYAYVPTLMKINDQALITLIEADCKHEELVFDFYTRFNIEKTTVTPEFIWVMESNFPSLLASL